MLSLLYLFFFNDTATTEIYTLSLHDALPIFSYWGDGAESNRPATNSPRISVDTNRVHCLVEKSGLDVDPWRLVSPIKQDAFLHIRV